jgi:hypothetical protein
MRISDDALKELISLYQEEFGEPIDLAAATEMGHQLLTLYRLLQRRLPNDGKRATESTGPHRQIGFRI